MSFGFAEHLFCDKKLFYLSHKCQHFCHLSICICEHCACICIINIYVCIKIHKYICMYICLAYLSNSFAGNIHRTWGPKDFEMSTFFCIAKCLRKTSKNEKKNERNQHPSIFCLILCDSFIYYFLLLCICFSWLLLLLLLVLACHKHTGTKSTHTHTRTHMQKEQETLKSLLHMSFYLCVCVFCVCVTCFSCLLFFYLFYYFFTFSYFLRCILRFFAVARLC